MLVLNYEVIFAPVSHVYITDCLSVFNGLRDHRHIPLTGNALFLRALAKKPRTKFVCLFFELPASIKELCWPLFATMLLTFLHPQVISETVKKCSKKGKNLIGFFVFFCGIFTIKLFWPLYLTMLMNFPPPPDGFRNCRHFPVAANAHYKG
jgi:hypothetical protein